VTIKLPGDGNSSGVLTVWQVALQGRGGRISQRTVRLGISAFGERVAQLEQLPWEAIESASAAAESAVNPKDLLGILNGPAGEMLHRELVHCGALSEGMSYSAKPLACFVVVQ
jgi:hypothetical protein